MGFKAKVPFSFDGKVYSVGQEVDIDNDEYVQKLVKTGLVVSGKGLSEAEVTEKTKADLVKEAEENAKKEAEKTKESNKRLKEKTGKPQTMKTVYATGEKPAPLEKKEFDSDKELQGVRDGNE